METKTCPICLSIFEVPNAHSHKRTCCSVKCAGKYKTQNFIKSANEKSTKICYRCKVEFPKSNFYKHNQKPDGLNPLCKECHKKTNAEMIAKNPEYYRKRSRDYMRKWRIGQNGKDLHGVKGKRDYPLNESCELCFEKVRLVYHHWDNADFSKGMWVCTKCHVAAHWLEKHDPTLFYHLKYQLSQ